MDPNTNPTLEAAQAALTAKRAADAAKRDDLQRRIDAKIAEFEAARQAKTEQDAAAQERRLRDQQERKRTAELAKFRAAYMAAGGRAEDVEPAFTRYIESLAVAALAGGKAELTL
jgi:hypothetical protein